MNDPNQIRINELARELEVKAKAIIDYLPEAGVTEKKTHSSSIELAAAEKVRKHFRDLADAEAAADAAAAADKAAKEAAAKTVRSKPQPVAPAPAAGPAAPPAAKPPVPAVVPAGLKPALAPVRQQNPRIRVLRSRWQPSLGLLLQRSNLPPPAPQSPNPSPPDLQ